MLNRNPIIAFAAVAMLLAAPFARGEEPAQEATHESLFKLNDGQKWQMDEHTRKAIDSIRKTLHRSTPSNLPDLKALGATLQAQIDGLIRGCTMTGDAHAQLHIFLSKFMPIATTLHDATDGAVAGQALSDARQLLTEYDQFFE